MLHSGIDGRVSEYGDYDPAHRDVTTLAAALESGNVRSATRREERGDIFIDGSWGEDPALSPSGYVYTERASQPHRSSAVPVIMNSRVEIRSAQ
jgi:hypothetical protein